MEGYYLYKVVPPMLAFIDDLTNWYIRRSRRRFWKSDDATDKASAYATLYEVLVEFSKVLAPVLPFVSERVYQHLVVGPGMAKPGEDSVHLCSYPQPDAARTDVHVEQQMAAVRQVVALGRALREKHKLKTRQPLQTLTVVSTDEVARTAVLAHRELIEDELNVKQVVALADDAALATLSFKANFKTMGKRMGAKMKDAATEVAALTRAQWSALERGETLTVQGQPLTKEDVLVTRTAQGEVVIESQGDLTVALDTTVTEALKREGLMRELVSRLQRQRKDQGLEVSDRIHVQIATTSTELVACVTEHDGKIREEVLAVKLELVASAAGEALDLEGIEATFTVSKA
jgi:isoleucyl-tRNA synthetase